MVDRADLVGQEKHEIAAVVAPLQCLVHAIELEGQIVAEGTIEPEIAVGGRPEQRHDRAQHGEDGRRPRAFLLGERAVRRLHHEVDAARLDREVRNILMAAQGLGDEAEKHFAPLVQSLDAEPAPLRGDDERRIDDARVPARVAAGILVVGGEHRAAPRVETVDHRLHRARVRDRLAHPRDGDAALGDVTLGSIGQGFHSGSSSSGPRAA